MLDPMEFGKAMAAIVRDAQAPLLERIKAIEERIAAQPAQGPAGERGPQGEAGQAGERGADGAPGEKGAQGERGEPGKDAEPIDMAEVIAQVLAGDELKTIVSLEVAAAIATVKAEPGKDGRDGKDGVDGARGEKGDVGASGKDGAGIGDLLIDRDGCLIATMTDGRTKNLGVVLGKDGAPGRDGADFSDASIDYDGERTITIRGNGGEITKRVPVPIDRGYWADGSRAEKGDVFTENGCVWIALRETKAKPSHENKEDWRLMVRKGRDGVDGRNGRDLGPAPPVKLSGAGDA